MCGVAEIRPAEAELHSVWVGTGNSFKPNTTQNGLADRLLRLFDWEKFLPAAFQKLHTTTYISYTMDTGGQLNRRLQG